MQVQHLIFTHTELRHTRSCHSPFVRFSLPSDIDLVHNVDGQSRTNDPQQRNVYSPDRHWQTLVATVIQFVILQHKIILLAWYSNGDISSSNSNTQAGVISLSLIVTFPLLYVPHAISIYLSPSDILSDFIGMYSLIKSSDVRVSLVNSCERESFCCHAHFKPLMSRVLFLFITLIWG